MVLKSPDIPSMLVETAFISNATDERRLRDAAYQQRVAEAIHAGVRDYLLRQAAARHQARRARRRAPRRRRRATQTLAER